MAEARTAIKKRIVEEETRVILDLSLAEARALTTLVAKSCGYPLDEKGNNVHMDLWKALEEVVPIPENYFKLEPSSSGSPRLVAAPGGPYAQKKEE
jgi:hypothetical protein